MADSTKPEVHSSVPSLGQQEGLTRAKKVVIIGGGFAGLNAAKKLGRESDLDVTIIDRRNHHLFQPLLYQVAIAGLSPGDIAVPIRTVLAKYRNVRVLLGDVQSVNLTSREVITDFDTISYDYLIMACGAQHSYFGNEKWEPFAPGLKTLEQATEIRRRVLTAFEMAERETDPEKVRQLLTFAVVGGGPTGVELAGALGELSRYTLSKDFRHIDPTSSRVILIEAGPRILPSFDPKLSERAVQDLERLGVTVWTDRRVTGITTDGVQLGDDMVKASTVLWGAGVKASQLNATLGVPLDRVGRVIIGPDLSVPGHPEVFVIGDQACFLEDGKPLPGLAPVAMQQGRFAAAMIMADVEGRARSTYKYLDKGQMATIGRKKAVAQTKSLKFGGVMAWFAWLLVHIYYLVGFKNRLIVMIQWTWSYFTLKRGAQLITNRDWRSFLTPEELAEQKKLPASPTASEASATPQNVTSSNRTPGSSGSTSGASGTPVPAH